MNKFNLKKLFKNFYFLFFLTFLIWMILIDSNGFVNRFKLSNKLNDLENEKNFYLDEIYKISNEKSQFESDKDLFERFAREQYLMKKKSEDIFYIVKE
ncbi:MAG: septum formation initiator [Marinoscillum sp.]|nr:septum formation initiator [Marinoscillum sp.]|tara:strand:+ start:33817 stop:34110 length:294 start_codon:yes stop_codon:yes gene_type:complete